MRETGQHTRHSTDCYADYTLKTIKSDRGIHVGVGVSVAPGVDGAKSLISLKLGNVILTKLPLDKDEALAVANFCREQKVYFIFSELLWRGTLRLCWATKEKIRRSEFYSKKDLEEIFRTGGEYFLGRYTLGEVGGKLYWPKEYLFNRASGQYRNLPRVNDMAEAKKAYLEYLKKTIAYERRLGDCPLLSVDSSLVFKYLLEAGMDTMVLESMPGNNTVMTAAIRGASRSFNHRSWGVHLAMQAYGGVDIDEFWLKRFKTALYYNYLAGSDFIFSESGHFVYK